MEPISGRYRLVHDNVTHGEIEVRLYKHRMIVDAPDWFSNGIFAGGKFVGAYVDKGADTATTTGLHGFHVMSWKGGQFVGYILTAHGRYVGGFEWIPQC